MSVDTATIDSRIPNSLIERYGSIENVPPVLIELAMQGKEFDHENGHISDEELRLLTAVHIVGKPDDWMSGTVIKDSELLPEVSEAHVNPDFMEVHNRLENNQEEISNCLDIMSNLVATGDMENEKDRVIYQAAERRIMFLVLESIRGEIGDPSEVTAILALRGARFFRDMLEEMFNGITITEILVKRMLLSDGTFAVGFSNFDIPLNSIPSTSRKRIVGIDDCLSTYMTQAELRDHVIEASADAIPDVIINPVTVGTVGGINHAYNDFANVQAKNEDLTNTKLIVASGGICKYVNSKMYLMLDKVNQMVGDMGGWNVKVNVIDLPPYNQPIDGFVKQIKAA
jgi:hypothetical protein